MSMSCTVCRDPNRAAIEDASTGGCSLREVSRKFPSVSAWAVRRHLLKCCPKFVAQARATETRVMELNQLSGSKIAQRVERLIVEAEGLFATAKLDKRWQVAIAALRENRAMLELLARLTGELGSGAGEHIPTVPAAAGASASASVTVTLPSPAAKPDIVALVRAIYHLEGNPRVLKPNPPIM
jgi:hypothetical protein